MRGICRWYISLPLPLCYLYIYPRHTLLLEPQHSSSPISFFPPFHFPPFCPLLTLSRKTARFVKEGRLASVQIKALSFMGFSRLVFLSFLVFLSCMQKREEKKTTVYNFCYTHDFFAFSIYIFFLEIFN